MKKYLGCDVKVNLCYRREKKKFCKGIGYILIDDYKKILTNGLMPVALVYYIENQWIIKLKNYYKCWSDKK